MDRKHDTVHHIALVSTDNSRINEREAFESHDQKKNRSDGSLKAICCPSAVEIPQRAHPLFIIPLIIVPDFSPHVICFSALPVPGGKV